MEEERLFGIEHTNASMLWYHQRNYNLGCKKTKVCAAHCRHWNLLTTSSLHG